MSSAVIIDKSVPQITREGLEHISPLHRFCAEELIKAGRLVIVEDIPGQTEK